MVFITPSVYSSPPSSRSLNTDVILCSYSKKPLPLQEICPRTTKRGSWRAWLSHQTYWPYHIKNLPKPFRWGIKKHRTNLIKTILYENRKNILLAFLILLLVFGAIGLWLFFGSRMSNPKNYGHIEEIPPPSGYERIAGTNPGYTQFFVRCPWKPKGSKVKLYTGGNAHFQTMNYAVVDLPVCPTPNSVPMLACVWRQNTCIRPDNTTRLNFKTSTASPCATAVGHHEKPFTAISADIWCCQHLLTLPRDAAPSIGRYPLVTSSSARKWQISWSCRHRCRCRRQ